MALRFGAANSDRVRITGTYLDAQNAFAVCQWVHFTALSAVKGLWYKGLTNARKVLAHSTANLTWVVDRVTTDSTGTTSSPTLTTGVDYCIVATFDETDGYRIFWGTLSTPMVEATYSARVVGVGTCISDAGSGFTVGNNGEASPNIAMSGTVAITQRYRRRFTLQDAEAWRQGLIGNAADCDVLLRLGQPGVGASTGTLLNESMLSGTSYASVVGCTLAEDPPLWVEEELLPFVSSGGAAPISGASTQALPLGGSATATLGIAGASSQALPLAGSATGTLGLTGDSSAALPLSGSAAATLLITADSSQPLPLGGTATGSIGDVITGESSKALPLAGTAAATLLITGTSTQALPLGGTAAGTASLNAVSIAALPLSGLATGTLLITAASTQALPLGGTATATSGGVVVAAVLIRGRGRLVLRVDGTGRLATTVEGRGRI